MSPRERLLERLRNAQMAVDANPRNWNNHTVVIKTARTVLDTPRPGPNQTTRSHREARL